MFVCQSFAKNFGLYCERVGALHIVAADPASAAAALSVLEVIIRPMYSNPPAHGARVVAHILTTPALEEVRAGRRRLAMESRPSHTPRSRTLSLSSARRSGGGSCWMP